jgi:hypothetical protein
VPLPPSAPTATIAATANTATKEEEDELERLLGQVRELTTWLQQELHRGNHRTATKFVARLRALVHPLLTAHLHDPRAKATILLVHEALSRYDQQVEGAEENLGLASYVRRMQRGAAEQGKQGVGEHLQEQEHEVEVDVEEEEEEEEEEEDYYSSGSYTSENDAEVDGGFGQSFGLNIQDI